MIFIPKNEDRIFKYGILPNKLKYNKNIPYIEDNDLFD